MLGLSPGARITHDSHRDVWIMGRSLERSAKIINSFSPDEFLAQDRCNRLTMGLDSQASFPLHKRQ